MQAAVDLKKLDTRLPGCCQFKQQIQCPSLLILSQLASRAAVIAFAGIDMFGR